jgi:plastocyanin
MKRALMLATMVAAMVTTAAAQDFHATVQVIHQTGKKAASSANVVVWLTPLDRKVEVEPLQHVRLIQRDKRFIPHLLVITSGTQVEFPNQDPFFHNVFSIYNGKRFDLGLYEAGSSRSVMFDRPGVSFIFCNIHPEMSGLVMVLNTPYYSVSGPKGDISIRNVPPGRYRVNYWYERSSTEALNKLAREITMPQQREAGTVEIPEVLPENVPHKNKYGKDYDPNQPYKP